MANSVTSILHFLLISHKLLLLALLNLKRPVRELKCLIYGTCYNWQQGFVIPRHGTSWSCRWV